MIQYNDASLSAHVPDFLAGDALAALRRQAEALDWRAAAVRDEAGEARVDPVHRRCRQATLDTTLARGLVGRIGATIAVVNQRWGLEIGAMTVREPGLILCDYRPGDGFHWHRDWCPTDANRRRKVSAVLQLSDEVDYVGGDLEFFTGAPGHEIWPAPRAAGTLIVFVSHVVHRVSEVTAGRRRSAMAFAQGLGSLR